MSEVKLKLSELKDNPRNYNQHPQEQIYSLAKSLELSGQIRPFVIDEDNMILCGHGMKLACMHLLTDGEHKGKKDMEVICWKLSNNRILEGFEDTSEENRKKELERRKFAILINDNEVAKLSKPDDNILADIIKSLDMRELVQLPSGNLDAILKEWNTDIETPEPEDLDDLSEYITIEIKNAQQLEQAKELVIKALTSARIEHEL